MKSITLMLMAFSLVSTAHAYNGTVNKYKYTDGSYCTFQKGDKLVDKDCNSSGTTCNTDGSCSSAGIMGTVKKESPRRANFQRANFQRSNVTDR